MIGAGLSAAVATRRRKGSDLLGQYTKGQRLRILDAFPDPELVPESRQNGFSEDEPFEFVRYVESAIDDPHIAVSRNLTGVFKEVNVSIGVIPPGTMEVPLPRNPNELGFHDRTALRFAVGPLKGNPLAAVERGRAVFAAG